MPKVFLWGVFAQVFIMGFLLTLLFSINQNPVSVTNPGIDDVKPDEVRCSDFYKRQDAQTFFDNNGGSNGEFKHLDGNKNGLACETLQ